MACVLCHGLVVSFVIALAWAAGADEAAAGPADHGFELHVRPLLVGRCAGCHGDDRRDGGIRLDAEDMWAEGGAGRALVTSDDPRRSRLIATLSVRGGDDASESDPHHTVDAAEYAALVEWVVGGAVWPRGLADGDQPQAGMFTAEQRAWWSLRPVAEVEPPRVDDAGWAQNPIDRFVYARLEAEGLEPSPEADARTLLRRAKMDLTGLPPTAEEVEAVAAGYSPEAWAELIDRLLDDPRYGERWGGHWLDLVRYSESDGYRGDFYRPFAWRYRDYVIRSFNADKPYDRFVAEQLAGDEVAPHDADAVVATGYLRNGIYEWNQRDARTHWSDILDEMTDVTGDVFLATSFRCARCHDHKFDPILQSDYYRLRAFFEPVLWRDDIPLASPEQVDRYERELRSWRDGHAGLLAELEAIEAPARDRGEEFAIVKFPDDVEAMARKPVGDRGPLERQLSDMVYRQVIWEQTENLKAHVAAEDRQRWQELREQLAEAEKTKPTLPGVMRVSDVGVQAPPTWVPGKESRGPIPPGAPSVLEPGPMHISPPPLAANSTGRRTALARWLTRPDNPLTARVIVNRVWQYHFGTGLVATSSDFGTLGSAPSHPQLLDWLTAEFIRNGWRINHLHRLIMTSRTYRQASDRRASDAAMLRDPDNRLLWRYPARRLDAEQIRDAMLAASGELDDDGGGPSAGRDSMRRSIYLRRERNNPIEMLKLFDAPDGYNPVAARSVTTTPGQALLLLNGEWTLARAAALGARVAERAGDDPNERVRLAYLLTLSREPESTEWVDGVTFLREQAALIADEAPAGESVDDAGDGDAAGKALADLCHVLVNSNEFVTIQ